MRGAAALLLIAILAAGCGAAHRRAATTTVAVKKPPAAPVAGLRIGIVGDLALPQIEGAVYERGKLADVATDPLVLVRADTPAAGRIAEVAAQYPSTHFAVVGGPTPDRKLDNVAGLVIQDDQAARLAGIVAGIVAADEGVAQPRVGWAGPEQPALAAAFGRGVHAVDRRTVILHAWSADVPAACKEAALAIVGRGAVAVLAPHGICAEAAAAGAHQQNIVALALDQFELPAVPAAQAVRDAVMGVYHGGEDILYGVKSGAVAVQALDPRITPEQAIRARQLSSQGTG